MTTQLRITLAQLDLFVGDIQGNLNKLIKAAVFARDQLAADVIIFPELSITGYPPEDLLFRKDFLESANQALLTFKEKVQNIYCIIGHPEQSENGLYNACSVIYNGEVIGRYAKQHLPNYGVFDECRYFIPGTSPCVVPIKGIPVGITICEDIWYDAPIEQAINLGARLILSANASPFEIDKHEQRQLTLANHAKKSSIPIVYVNCIGGQDELVFDGGSMVVNANGEICQHAGFFNETLFPVDLQFSQNEINIEAKKISIPSIEERVYSALVVGVRDYIKKNHFTGAIIGVSGGIDSALTLAIAEDALGKENITAVLMPSRYTSEISNEDAITLTKNLSIDHEIISIEPVYQAFLTALDPILSNKKPDITEENLQSRCRGVILMAISNKTGRIVLTTGNRSELAVGYATLFGDMAGGLCVLKDISKDLVYRLALYRNQISPIIPERTLQRAPTAELAFDQKDEDTLPPYPILDKILELYLNNELSADEIIAKGYARETVSKVIRLINKSEYKRRQAPVGIRINHKSFGRDRRYPISSGYKG